MYNEIASNKRRTVLLIAIFVVIVLALGWVIGQMTGYGYSGLVYAAIISFAMALFSYYSGDKIALAVAGAKGPLQQQENLYLWRIVENLCLANGQPMPKIYTIPDQAINAFATGRDPQHSSIAVTKGAIEKLTNEELEGVLAHELSHIKNYDIRLMMVVIVLVGIISLLANWMFHFRLGGRGSDNRDSGASSLFVIFGIVMILISPIIAELIKLAVSRRREYLADASGVLLTRYPEGLANALQKIAAENQPMAKATEATAHLYIANPFAGSRKLLTNLFSTHPPIQDRIKKLREMGV
ncbi:MAG: M48 family metallopeptidase [bacterium]|nr:M48 family metallopeptidase [bacterium]